MEKSEEELQAVNGTVGVLAQEHMVNLNSWEDTLTSYGGNRSSGSINQLTVAQKSVCRLHHTGNIRAKQVTPYSLLSSPSCTPQVSVLLKAKVPKKLISGWDDLMKKMWGRMT